MLEGDYKTRLTRKILRLLPGSFVLRNDANLIQGIPDLTVLWGRAWGVLEVKISEDAPYQPNQEYYLDLLGGMSYSATIYPENEEDILHELHHTLKPRW